MRPRIVILFAGAAKTRGAFHLTMDANDAIETAHAFPQAEIVAAHADGWAHFSESGADLTRAFATLGLKERCQVLEPGRPLRLALGPDGSGSDINTAPAVPRRSGQAL